MKRRLLPMILLAALMLTGCGSHAAEKQYRQFSEALAARDSLSFQSALRAEYPDKTVSFTLSFSRQDGRDTVTVIAPELVAGVTAHLSGGNTQLEFDGMVLDTGPLDESGLVPLSALSRLVDTLAGGHLNASWEEQGETVYQLVADDHLSARVWFRTADMIPTYAELLSDGDVTVCCEIENWR